MNLDISGKRAVVSGSTAGIGFATAQLLAAEGAQVVVNGGTESRVAAALEAIRKALPKAQVRGVAADLGSADGCAKLTAAVPEADILVNNVGIFDAEALRRDRRRRLDALLRGERAQRR